MIWTWAALASAAPPPPPPLAIDRVFNHLPAPEADPARTLRSAAEAWGPAVVDFAGRPLDAALLRQLADKPPAEPWTRHLREVLARPVDPEDFYLFLDDLAGALGRPPAEALAFPIGRLRNAGVLLHPDDVFRENKPRSYATSARTLEQFAPAPQKSYPLPADGDPLGPEWTMRYRNPEGRQAMLEALHAARPTSTFPSRLAGLLTQLEAQTEHVWLATTLRDRRRGYLMWGCHSLSKTKGDEATEEVLQRLEDRNVRWELNLPITWRHPDGLEATRRAATLMAETYDVVYTTEEGARTSHHYDGEAFDLVAVGLPRRLELWAPDGAHQVFDLSDPENPRDLQLDVPLVRWIEEHYDFDKLELDYPHWDDRFR